MNNPLVLTFDLGTQSMRAMLVDKKGNIVDNATKKYERPYISRNPGWAEQRPDFYYDALKETSERLLDRNRQKINDIISVTITTIRDTALCLDENNEPLRDIILWLDKRETKSSPIISFAKKTVFNLVGVHDVIEMQYRQAVCNWIMENQPEIWDKTAKYVMISSYMNYKLTGNLIDTYTNMIGHIPMDYKNHKWYKKNQGITRFLFDVPESKLVDLINPGEEIGRITKQVSKETLIPEGIPLIATGSDKACETLGLSVIHDNQAALSFGTTATVQFASKKYFEPLPFAPSYPFVIDGMYNAEIQIYRGYWMISWFKREFAKKEMFEAKELGCSAEELLNKHLKDIPAGCDGLVLQPYWGPGVSTPNARGAIVGFSDVHTRAHIYRAIIEGIGFALIEGLNSMEKRGKVKIDEIYVGGGGSQSDEICQITADMFGLKVKRIQTHETCGLGSSMIAFVAKKEFESYEEAINSMCHDTDIFEPNMDIHKVYKHLYNDVYCKIYDRLQPLYKKIKTFTKRRELL